MMENKIIDLETKLAYQEHTIQELNDALAHQQQELTALKLAMAQVQEMVRQLTPTNIASQAEETPPPHY